MTQYIKMPQADESGYSFIGFKARYLELSGEKVQNVPAENDTQSHYLVGSSRLSQGDTDTLVAEFPMVSATVDAFPGGWVPLVLGE